MLQFSGFISGLAISNGNILAALMLQQQAPSTDTVKILVAIMSVVAFISILGLVIVVRLYFSWKAAYVQMKSHKEQVEHKKEELLFTAESLKDLNKEKNTIISVAAHDLKTPLNNIEGLVNLVMMEKEKLSSDQLSYLKLMQETAIKARLTIDGILDVHKIESEVEELKAGRIDFIPLLEEIIKTQSTLAKNKMISVTLEADFARTKVLQTDPSYFRLIFSNLLSNAVKYSPPDKKITILVTETENTIRIAVDDQGPGMDERTKKRLFAPYSRVSGSNGGDKVIGHGLALTRKLIEKLNGKLQVESTFGEGSTFMVEFFK